jgi:hypothetical protein
MLHETMSNLVVQTTGTFSYRSIGQLRVNLEKVSLDLDVLQSVGDWLIYADLNVSS